ncbi:putative G-type lectin S-receptor-like serine/threonine-protein kinase [Raphanus sativus]|nr:putative G-type lectin S-receptor-like serine/threonine-protein kinase [Raphanus sativus]
MAEFMRNLTLVTTTLMVLLQLCSIVSCTTSTSITTINNTIRDGDSLISEEEVFELGFFSPKDSSLRYVGIWYKNIEPQTIVWVANRESPLSDHNGALKLADDGNLAVVDGQNNTVWSTNVPPKLNNTVAVLLETGDLVLSLDSDRDTRYWESFNNPTDTFLPGMRVRVNPSSGENHAFTPWNSENDPSPGRYSLGIDPIGAPEIVIWEGGTRKWRSGPWDSVIFTGIPDMFRNTNFIYGFKLSAPPERDGSVYFTYVPSDSSDLLRFRVRFDGVVEQFRWDKDARRWTLLQLKPSTECEKYNRCGNYSVCDESKEFGSGKCSCIDGFEPVSRNLWDDGDFSGGCKRRVLLNCSQTLREDEFVELSGMKLPDFGSVVTLGNSETCKDVCVRDCLCNAYAFVRGIGCMIWTRDLIDMERFEDGGQSINVRLAESEIGGRENSKLWIVIVSVIGAFLLGLCIWTLLKLKKRVKAILWRKKDFPVFEEKKDYSVKSSNSTIQVLVGGLVDTPDFPIFSFNTVALATGNFAEENKLGHGGFGTVYKGNFPGDREIAAWNLWSQGKTKELIDPTVKDTQDVNEAMKCIHVGMLCTQESVIYRPNIGSVLLMLESRMSHLPRPRQPTFHSFLNSGEIVEGQDVATVNDITLTTVVGR